MEAGSLLLLFAIFTSIRHNTIQDEAVCTVAQIAINWSFQGGDTDVTIAQ